MIDSLYTAKSGLTTSKYAVDTTSNNIANENTEGYNKRVVNLSEIDTYGDITGNGVTIENISRTTNVYLYNQLVSQNSLSTYYTQEESTLSNIETLFSETDSTGFSVTLSNYFDAIETLRADSSSLVNQNELENQTELLVEGIKSLYAELEDAQETAMAQLEEQVDSINQIIQEIASINKDIQNSSTSANDLLDKRDALELELSNYVDIDVDTSDGNYSLSIGGSVAIFNGLSAKEVTIDEEYISQKDIYDTDAFDDSNVTDGTTVTLTLNNTTTITLTASTSGSDENELKNQIISEIESNSEFDDIEAYLDTSGNLIVKSKLEGEESAFTLDITVDGTTVEKSDTSIEGSNSVSLAIYGNSIELSSGSTKSLTQNLTTSTSSISSYKQSLDDLANALVEITSSASSTKLFNGSSVNTLEYISNSINDLSSDDLEALAQIQWSDEYNIDSTSSDTTSLKEFYQNLLVTISSDVETVSFKLESQESILNSLQNTYDNLTKVDTDEEMINLLQYQAAYEANAKIITAVDEMIQTLLDM